MGRLEDNKFGDDDARKEVFNTEDDPPRDDEVLELLSLGFEVAFGEFGNG